MKIFSGTSNLDLAKKISQVSGLNLGEVEISRFANGESRIWVKEEQVGSKVVLVQSLSEPTDAHLTEFALLADALERKGAKEIVAVIPWLGYSKQDKVFRPGEPLSVAVVAKILSMGPIAKVITFALHHPEIANHFSVPVVELSARGLFEEHYLKQDLTDWVVVAPDAGAIKSNSLFANNLKMPLVKLEKTRDKVTGQVEIVGISGQVEGKKVIIKDDMVVTGGTLLHAAKFLKDKGAKSVEVVATHHLYVPGAQQKIDESFIDQLIVTDTVAAKDKSPKLKILSVAELIAEEIGV